jgi:multicomponent Na+:H+ antiporter subunit B
MKSIILSTVSTFLLPLLLLFSIFIFLRGHYLPGGGFIGGLIASIGFVLYSAANGLKKTKTLLRIHPGFLMPIGLTIALLSGLSGIFFKGKEFLTGVWFKDPFPVIGMVGSPLFFDIGVYLVVVGATLTIVMTITETA